MASHKPPLPSVWQTKKRVEALFPDFPDFDVNSADFDLDKYLNVVRSMIQAADIPLTPFHVTWDSLTSTVPLQSSQMAITNVISMFQGIVQGVRNGFAAVHPKRHPDQLPESHTADILHDVSGYVNPGEMLLVIGTPGSGTSLLLNQLAGRQMASLIETDGRVLYEGLQKLAGSTRPSHFTHYVQQYDHHIPSLTVRHTLEFAAQCRWPAWIPHVEHIRRNDVLLVAKILGISRTLDTIVGSDILRGVSGGERKRVTLGEMGIGLVAGSLIMDNWSKGLDSATALSITQSMRHFADATKGVVIASMQAPGSELFNLFDNLCLLHQGRVIYFGPTGEAEHYFNNLGFTRPKYRSVPDFVSTITDASIRTQYITHETMDLEHPPPLPTSAEEFAECYNNSSYNQHVKKSIEEINIHSAENRPEVLPHIAKIGSHAVLQQPRFQLKALITRQARYLHSTRNDVFSELAEHLIFGIILGSIFWQLPDTISGAQSRSGIIFLALLFVGLGALASVQTKFEDKVIFSKQKAASFFNPWTYLLCQACFDFLLELIKSIFLIVPLYLMSGLNIGSSGQRLLFAVIICTFFSLTVISFIRFFVAAFDDPNAAQGACGLLIIMMVLFTGYLKSPNDLQGWLIWIYWINPLHYPFEALLINEFDGLSIICGSTLENFDPCLIRTGNQYIASTVGITEDKIYRLYFFIIVVSFNIFFFIISAIATTRAKPPGHPQSSQLRKDANVQEGTVLSETVVDLNDNSPLESEKTVFTFTNMVYKVDHGAKTLLHNVTGNSVAGKVVLLMGESGAGKTTLLDVCAIRKTLKGGASLEGDIRVNGLPVTSKTLSLVSGYCEQSDLHIGEATVREALLFSAKLRLPKSMGIKEKKKRVQATITQLGLEPYSDILVKGLGSGELKLLTMAVEVVSDPKVLFLDEPTSGISSSSAMIVARVLRNVAATGACVICTVHQPSREVFTMFDRLLLLKRGGKVVYFGDIGQNGDAIRNYFEANGAEKMKQSANPADWMLDVIDDNSIDWVEQWQNSPERKVADDETNQLAGNSNGDEDKANMEKQDMRPGLFPQTREVIRRQFWRYWRLPEYNTTRVILIFMIAFLVGLLFLQEIDDTQLGAQLGFAALFLTLIPSNLAAQNVVEPTASGRAVFYREIAAGLYRPVAHHLAVGIVELPFSIVSTTVFALVFYFMVGLDTARFFYFFVALQVLYTFAVMFGIMMAVITPAPNLARMLASSMFSLLIVLSGFFITKPEMPVWWRWSVWVNPFAYYLSGVVVNQMSGRVFRCTPEQFSRFPLPSEFSSCEELPGIRKFSTVAVTGECQFCPTESGQALIDQFAADDVNKWVAVVAMIVAIVIIRIVTGFGFAKLRYLTR